MEGLLYDMLEREAPRHTSKHEQLGECMIEAGHELGPGTLYGEFWLVSAQAGSLRCETAKNGNPYIDCDM